MAERLLAMLAVLALVLPCALAEEKAGPAKDATVLEVESFKLTKAAVKEVKEASGGKVVVLEGETSEAEHTIANLKAGKYELVVYGVAPSPDEDAFYVVIGDQPEERRFITEIGKVAPSGKVEFTVEKDGPCKIVIKFGEENVQFDRVEIKPVPPPKAAE